MHVLTCFLRRGDRSNAEMKDYGVLYWQRSSPQRIAELVHAERLFVMTNSGSKTDRDYLRENANAIFLPPDVFSDWYGYTGRSIDIEVI